MRLPCALAVLLAAVPAAHAAISYSYVTDASTYTANGAAVTVNVYLRESLDGGGASLLGLPAQSGLYGAGFKVVWVSGSGVQITGVTGDGGVLSGGSVAPAFSTTQATLLESTAYSLQQGPTPNAQGLIYLGSVSFSATAADGAATYQVGRYDNLGGNTLTMKGTDLDFNCVSPAFVGATAATTFTVAVPEPGSLALLALAGLLQLRCRGTGTM